MATDKKLTNDKPKYSASYWSTEIHNAKKRHDAFFWKEASESIRVYNTRFKLENVQRRVNVWWYIVNTLLPAYYSSTPKAEVDLRKYAGSQILDLSAVILERNVQHSMDVDFDFDFVGFNSALQFLLTGRAILWARYEAEFAEATAIPMFPVEGGIVDADGNPYQGDLAELEETKEGLVYNLTPIEAQRAILESVHITDYLNSDARNEEEICWRARRAFLSRAEAEEKGFAVKDLNFDSFPDTTREDRVTKVDERNPRDGKAELWEIWSEEQDKVIWIQAKGKKSILETSDVPIKYAGFYPCSVINASIDPDSTIPTSDYSHAKDQILEVERLAERKHAMIQAIRANGVYNPTLGDIAQQMFTGDLKMSPAQSWPSHKAQGGLNGQMEYLNIDPYVNALGIISQELEAAKQSLFQMLKVSDLLQGISNPTKTATANRLENAWSSLGLIVRQNQFAKFIGDGLEKLGTVIASQFEASQLLDNGDAQSLLSPLVTPDMPYEMLAQQVIDPLKNTRELFKLQIASDSMVALDERQERADTADLLNSTGAFFDQMTGMVEKYPALMPLSLEMFKKVIRSYKGGKELEAAFTNALMTVGQQVQQQMNQPPAPDPKAMEIQGRMQIAQIEAQNEQAKLQFEMQVEGTKAQMEQMKAQMDMQAEQQRGALEQWKAQQDVMIRQGDQQLKARSLEIEVLKIQAASGSQQADIALKEKIVAIDTLLQQQAMKLDTHEKQLALDERLQDNRRFETDTAIEVHKVAQKDVELGIKAKEVEVKEKAVNKPIPKPSAGK